ncbi:MAG TPA: hypothetical protein VFR72_01995 [Gemmatimonadales bacterium]|nr:hypothetical protein [Gemmatimonadales bacterium]
MHGSLRWLTLILILAGCRERRSETAGAEAPEVAATPNDGGSGQAEPGVEFEAPRLIPGIRAQMAEIEGPQAATEGNLTAFKNGVGTLIDAMKADLNRVGIGDTGAFRALSDSIGREIGGGAGTTPDLPPEQASRATARVDHLIGMYEERMRRAAQ